MEGFPLFLTFHLLFVISLSLTHGKIASNETDLSALLSFKSSISSDPYNILSSWNNTLHHCKWTGVQCGSSHPDRVTGLVLATYQMSGYISPSLANLSFLQNLNLSHNQLGGNIPEEFGGCTRLKSLDLRMNSLGGGIPSSLSNCSNLQVLYLWDNLLQGTIPPSLGNLTSLCVLGLSQNNITGEIPSSFEKLKSLTELGISRNQLSGEIPAILGRLKSLKYLLLAVNNLSGKIPNSLYNLSSMIDLELGDNQLEGTLPFEMCDNFPNVQFFYAYQNHLTGEIPPSISNCSALVDLELADNNLTGVIPSSIGNLKNLYWLHIGQNLLEAKTPKDWSFMDSLINCTNLQFLNIGSNKLEGVFPSSIGNLSISLFYLGLYGNSISGRIPSEIGKLTNLIYIEIHEALLEGSIPVEIGNLFKLQELYLSNNILSGEIPSILGNLTSMNELSLDNNAFEGMIPPELSNMQGLQILDLSSNKLSGEIPKELMNLFSLSDLIDLSYNYLNGSLPSEIGKLKNIAAINVSNNKLSGEIPSTIEGCQLLQTLDLHGNLFEGNIPSTFNNLKGLQQLDLSNNSFLGQVPEYFSSMNLTYLNLSFNNFKGNLPDIMDFKNVSAIDVRGNPKLCGGVPEMHLPKCNISEISTHIHHFRRIMLIIFPVIGALICLFIIATFFAFRFWKSPKRSQTIIGITPQYKQVSYDEIFRATDGFSLDNLIGKGGFGAVYKALMNFDDTTIVAVKVLNLEQHGASRSFFSECEALRSIKHRNLVKVLSSCSSIDHQGNDFKALIFEFMPNGSLETWLHPNYCIDRPFISLNIIQRLNIVIDVALALEYLHHHGSIPVIHRDLKPSNVLLDDDMTAHVSDFGLAKFLPQTDDMFSQPIESTSGIKGSIGYIPPEYGMGGKASAQGDIYSYGILLLEICTGISPTDDRFNDGLSLHNFVEASFPDKIMHIIDTKLAFTNDEENNEEMQESIHDCFVLVIRCALLCSKESPQERAGIEQVMKDLVLARKKLLRQDR